MINLEIKKYLTLFTLITILIVAPLATPIAFADDKEDKKHKEKSEPITLSAFIEGGVIDLGTQKYKIEGKEGSSSSIKASEEFEEELAVQTPVSGENGHSAS